MNATARPSRRAFSRATSSASALASTAVTCASRPAAFRLCAMARAIAPLPVPRSRTFNRRRQARRFQHGQRPLHQGFGVGPGHQHARIHLQRQAEKLLAADDVGQRLAGRPGAGSGRGTPRQPRCASASVSCASSQDAGAGGFAQRVQQQQLGVEPVQAQRLGGGQGLRASHGIHGQGLFAIKIIAACACVYAQTGDFA